MIFDNLIYPDNKKKEQRLKNLEIEVIKLFENYKEAWNEFCNQIKIGGIELKLEKSIKENSIEECLEEIDNATKKLNDIVKNASEILESEQLLGKTNNRYGVLTGDIVHRIIKYSPLITGGGFGIGVAVLLYRQMLKKSDFERNVLRDNISNILNKEYMDVKNIVYNMPGMWCAWQESGSNIIQKQKDYVYNNTYGKIVKASIELKNQINMIEDETLKKYINEEVEQQMAGYIRCMREEINAMNRKVDSYLRELKNEVISTEKKLLNTMHERISEFRSFINKNYKDGSNNAEWIKKCKEELIDNLKEGDLENVNLANTNEELLLGDIKKYNKEFRKNKTGKENKNQAFKAGVLGVMIVIAMVVIMDVITSCIEGIMRSKELNKRLEQMNNIVGELTRTIGYETNNLIRVTQSIKDGVIRIDKERMFIIDKSTSESIVIKVL
ncbi:MAG: hypothetical protein ACRCSG_05175 [Cellulosilyticaceae bacterium]